MHPAALEKSRQIAKAVTDNLGGQGLFGVELFVKGEQVWFSEVSPARTTPAWSRCAPSTRASSSGTPALSWPARGHQPAQPRRQCCDLWRHGSPQASCSTDETLSVPGTDLCACSANPRVLLRRMGVVLARAADVETARSNAKLAAGKESSRVRFDAGLPRMGPSAYSVSAGSYHFSMICGCADRRRHAGASLPNLPPVSLRNKSSRLAGRCSVRRWPPLAQRLQQGWAFCV